MTVFGCFLRFPHKDFIASIRIFFAMKCRPTEDVRMHFWLETKMQARQPPGNTLQSQLFLVTKLSFGETVVCTPFFFFIDVLPWEKYVFYFSLLVLLSTKLTQGLLVVFCFMFCIFRFLVSDKNSELIRVSFVYFVRFVIRFFFVNKVLYRRMNTQHKSSLQHF